MIRTHRLLLGWLAAVLLLPVAVEAADTRAQRELRARRAALSRAVNSGQWEKVLAFYHPSCRVTGIDGTTLTYPQMKQLLPLTAQLAPNLREQITIEKITVKGNTATMVARDTTTFTGPDGQPQVMRLRVTQTWRKFGRQWLIVREVAKELA